MADNTKNILIGAGGVFTSILGLASGNAAAVGGGLSSLYSILSPTQRSTIQYGSNTAMAANSQYNQALNSLSGSSGIPSWLLIGGLGFILWRVAKSFMRR
jgi:hypothetical protein